jgi:hypothetical protein
MDFRLILNGFRQFLSEAEIKYDEFVGDSYIIDIDNLSVVASKHADERSRRHVGQRGSGGAAAGKISRDSIHKALDRALPQILDDFINGELDNKEAFHVQASQGDQPALNIIGKLDMRKGPDKMVLVTMMRKDDFRTDAFGGGEQKTYEVSI